MEAIKDDDVGLLTSEGFTPAAGSLIGCIGFIVSTVQESQDLKRSFYDYSIWAQKDRNAVESRDLQPRLVLAFSLAVQIDRKICSCQRVRK